MTAILFCLCNFYNVKRPQLLKLSDVGAILKFQIINIIIINSIEKKGQKTPGIDMDTIQKKILNHYHELKTNIKHENSFQKL